MLFNSIEFLLFLPIVFILYWFFFGKMHRWQNLLILLVSYFFYGWWSYHFLALLILSTFIDYIYGFAVGSGNKRKAKLFLWLSIINNLGILAIFKYYNFFVTELIQGLELLGFNAHPTLLKVALPVGISFYTFHGMSYVFDIYRGKIKPVNGFVEYAVFVAFFPLLVAGPIERANHLLPQIRKSRVFNFKQAVEGCRLILWGMFKKVIIADTLASSVDFIFGNYQTVNGSTLLLGAFAFSFQIYGDFSGYSDIALGTSKLFGFELLSNFKFPYFSRDIAEFWRRWHVSLSSWFRDYLYIPLGGSKEGKLKAVSNTFMIFLVSGFWHGASWNFIVWGFIHACGFLPFLLFNRNRIHTLEVVAHDRAFPNLKEVWQMTATLSFVTLAWIFFRADSISIAFDYIKHLLQSLYEQPIQVPIRGSVLFYIIPFIFIDWSFRRDERTLKMPPWPKPILWLIYLVMTVWTFNLLLVSKNQFIYFQF